MAIKDHEKGDIEIKILGFESNWYKQTAKETIPIKGIKQTLNEDEGRYISPIFDQFLQSSPAIDWHYKPMA